MLRKSVIISKDAEDVKIYAYLKNADSQTKNKFNKQNITVFEFSYLHDLEELLKKLQPHSILYEGSNTSTEWTSTIMNYCTKLIHFDDLGDGAANLVALYEDFPEFNIKNQLNGSYAFAVHPLLKAIQHARDNRLENDVPHICIYFEDGDINNLTYRCLRHLTLLQISVIIYPHYKYDITSIQILALTHCNTSIYYEQQITAVLQSTDIIICNSLYTPYKIAVIGIPCITFA